MTKTLPRARRPHARADGAAPAVIAFAVTLTGGLAREVGDVIGVGDTAVEVWGIAKWPVLLLLVSLLLARALLGRAEREAALPHSSRPAALVAVLGWVLASVGCSRSTSRTSAPTTRPTGRWPARSCSCCGCGSRTSASCSGPSSTPSSSGAASSSPARSPSEDEQFVELRDTEKLDDET